LLYLFSFRSVNQIWLFLSNLIFILKLRLQDAVLNGRFKQTKDQERELLHFYFFSK
jgi:hypothetical protein